MSTVEKVKLIPKDKENDFIFLGKLSFGREWIMKYENVSESLYGRDPKKKYIFHREYFEQLCSAKYVLCPTGDCPWSYRFFEAIMCFSIPVLGDDENDIFSDNFFFYKDSETKKYSEDICRQNYLTFLANHTFSKFRNK
jgi:hypothetical protein